MHIYFILLLFSLVLLCPNTIIGANSASIANLQLLEKQALLHFKASLEDPNGQLSTWRPEDDDTCNWNGVTCNNQTRHVTELHLSSYHLGGDLSPSLVNLTYLNHLDLSHNLFNGTIPNFIGSMTQLRYLDLSFDSFHGTIPRSISSLTKLRYLDLSHNLFNGTIPIFIGSMTQLRYLDLSFDYFHGTIPRPIGSLTQLRYLGLSGNFLYGNIPPEFGNLTNLRNLSLGPIERCKVENLDWLCNLSQLLHLHMEGISLAKANHWVDVVLSLKKLSYLSLWGCDLSEVMHPYSSSVNSSSPSIGFLGLGHNNLRSSMYSWLFPLTSNRLFSLDLSSNMLDRIPKYLGNLCDLTSLYISNNSAAVKFPDFLTNLSGCTSATLRELDASNGQFTGSLSDEIHQFSSLRSLSLSHNQLNGTMSEKVWELPNLETLDVSSNSIRYVISERIGKSKLRKIDLSELIPSKEHPLSSSYIEYIDLSGCMLGPLFPKWIRTNKTLTHLNIANTSISDTIPVEFWKIWHSRFTYLNLSSNNISGKVPYLASIFDLYPTIDLSSNNFSGPIPNVPPTLVSLNLSKNKFNGGISFLCHIFGGFLSLLDLSYNSLTGQLPDCLWHFKELRVLNLGHNNLSGRIPGSIGYLVRLEVLHLKNNDFSGELPLALKNCTELKILDLGTNKFLGNVPAWVGKDLTRLYGLSLRSNNFSGPIPVQLCHLLKVQILDLSINNLNGTIPPCIFNLNAMVQGSFLRRQHIHRFGMAYYEKDDITMIISNISSMTIEWQGNVREFTSNLGLWTILDLSSNHLTGELPDELTDLHELYVLNLSRNALFGQIPREIGEIKYLETLDLSRNKFSGGIPSSMAQMVFLSFLDMSHNSLSGRIPSSTQLQSFEPSRYTGNAGLCGLPVLKRCPGDEEFEAVPMGESEGGEEGIDELWRWFLIGGGTGFVTGFWIACGALLLNRHGRRAFFHFVDFLKDWVYVKVKVLKDWVYVKVLVFTIMVYILFFILAYCFMH